MARATNESKKRLRIALISARNFSRAAFQCGHLEAQDVLAECEDVDLICLEAEPGFRRKQQWLRRLMYRDVSRQLAYFNPGLKRVTLTKDYDVLIVMCQTYWDFLNVNAIDGWKDHCRTSICWMDELWAASLPLYTYWLPSLKRFDHVVVGMLGTVEPLSKVLDRQCHYVPGGVDTLRFAPDPDQGDRAVDVYSVGRRWEGIHQALVQEAAGGEFFYIYDTLQTGESQAADHRQHRDLYANVAKRSKFFLVAPGKVNVQEETKGQVEIGFRYYEGSAAGTVMVGQPPDMDRFRSMFDWPDAVVHLQPDGSDTKRVLRGLMAEPDRMLEISRRNAQGALLRHDWIYRWRQILEIAGLQPGPDVDARDAKLRALAEYANSMSYGR